MTPIARTRRLSFLAALIAALLLLVAVPAQPAMADTHPNVAQAVNDKDGSSVIDIAFDIRRVSSGVVDQTNVAAAYATCNSCQTVAIAIQIVLVSGGANTITPTNVAVALNEGCNACQTMALAYQFIFGNGDTLVFTPEGRKRLNEVRRDLRELAGEGLTNEEIKARVTELTDEIRDILATEVVSRGRDDDEREGDRDRRDDEAGAGTDDGTTTEEEPVPDGTPPADDRSGTGPGGSPSTQPEQTTPPENGAGGGGSAPGTTTPGSPASPTP